MIETLTILDLLEVTLILCIVYGVGRVLLIMININAVRFGYQKWIERISMLLTPGVILLGVLLLLIKAPLFISILLAFLLLLFRPYVENYFLGTFFRLNAKIDQKTHIHTAEVEGLISDFALNGLWLQSGSGYHFITYKKLIEQGYSLANSQRMAAQFVLLIPLPDTARDQYIGLVNDLLITSPLIDVKQGINIVIRQDIAEINIGLRNKEHFQDLIAYLNENQISIKEV